MRKVLVTGASRGLGLGIVRRLVCEGYCAIAVARHMNDELASTIEHAGHAHPGSLHFLPFDLGDVEEIPNVVRKLRNRSGSGAARVTDEMRDALLSWHWNSGFQKFSG